MKQLLQFPNSGEVLSVDVPVPLPEPGHVLVSVARSLVSAGTERMVVDFAEKNLLQKARARPDLVRQTLAKARRDSVLTTIEGVQNRLAQPLALGYSCAGSVLEVGANASEFQVGDHVACAGGGYAVHGEVVSVPKNLVTRLPPGVDWESAASTTLGAVALQGIRLADVQIGQTVAVVGLGLLGQLTVQILKASGCQVIGMDIQPDRAELAASLGADATASTADQMRALCQQFSDGHGVDAVLITADTKSNQPVELAGDLARDRGIVVAVGAVGMDIPRKVYYEKELDFRISRSYGPGRYDPDYEEKGHDYPIGYVRWTENRNMQAFVQLLAEDKVDVKPLITHRFPIDEAPRAYDLITNQTDEPYLGVLITYPDQPDLSRKITLKETQEVERSASQRAAIGLLGAGNFATSTLLPAMQKVEDIAFVGVCTATGLSARHAGDKFDFHYCTTDESEILNDPDINTIVIATRHHLHARQVIAALEAGKHVFCEKPLALNVEELDSITETFNLQPSNLLTVGYNRRFAPMAQQLKDFLAKIHEPLVMHYRVNAGYIPPDHWTQDPEQGGGRIIGEACHFVDFLTFLTGSLPVRVSARALPNNGRYCNDNVVADLEFADEFLGTITYVANGDKSFPKERVEVFGGGSVAVLENFRRLELIRNGKKDVHRSFLRQDKGHQGEWEAFVTALKNAGPPLIPFEQLVATSLTTFAIQQSLKTGETITVGSSTGRSEGSSARSDP